MTWRAQVAAAAVSERSLDVDPSLRRELLAALPYGQVFVLLADPADLRLLPVQVRLLDALATLDSGPGGRVYRWLWGQCLWPPVWRLPNKASTGGLTPAWIRRHIASSIGRPGGPASLDLPGVTACPLGLGSAAYTIEPGQLPHFDEPGMFLDGGGP